LGGVNSGAFGAIRQGQVIAVGQAESADLDPNDENFCDYGTHQKCLPVLWNGNRITELPTLGGNNGSAGPINVRGEIGGTVETDVRDPDCPGIAASNGTGPIVLDYKGVVWGPRLGQMRQLKPLSGDTVSIALWINEKGEAVGISGTCANTVVPPTAYGPHAVLWDGDGRPHDLGNLGSTAANAGLSINNRGQVVGASSPTDQSTTFNGVLAFLWTREKGIKSLGVLPGDVASGATGINDRGEVIGASIDPMGNPRAVVWHDASIADLNDLAVADSPFDVLLLAFGINDAGEIVGFGVTTGGDVHGFLATPCEDSELFVKGPRHQTVVPEYMRDMLRARLGGRR
jgi:probable HAF family extracellular repeat protein